MTEGLDKTSANSRTLRPGWHRLRGQLQRDWIEATSALTVPLLPIPDRGGHPQGYVLRILARVY